MANPLESFPVKKCFIKLNSNKAPIEKNWPTYDFMDIESFSHVGIPVPSPFIVVDIDNMEDAEKLTRLVIEQNIKCQIMQTARGRHFWFTISEPLKNSVKAMTGIGLSADFRSHGKHAQVCVKIGGEWRRWLTSCPWDEIGELPRCLRPINQSKWNFTAMGDGDGRNQALFEYQIFLRKHGYSDREIIETERLINNYIFNEPLSEEEFEKIERPEAINGIKAVSPGEEFAPENSDSSEIAELYRKTNRYLIRDNRTYAIKNGPHGEAQCQAIFQGAIRIEKVIVRDDGLESNRYFTIVGYDQFGRQVPSFEVAASKFSSMNWVTECLPSYCAITPGQSAKEQLRYALQITSENAPQKHVYTHTGFARIGGKLHFLSHGHVLGEKGEEVICELDPGLSGYSFTNRNDITPIEAVSEVMNLTGVANDEISLPLLAFMYLGPLGYFLGQAGLSPSFLLYVKGETGAYKTSLSNLWLSSFRKYSGFTDLAPASFHDTGNAIEKKAFVIKDEVFFVDDLHPSSPIERRKMNDIAQRLARGAGDHAARGRMNADTTLHAAYTPRGLSMVSGEDCPDIGQSGLARFFFVNFKKGDVSFSKLVGQQGKADYLNAAMKFFILWLIENEGYVIDVLPGLFRIHAEEVKIHDAHSRLPANLAWLQTSIDIFTEYARDVGALKADELNEFRDRSWTTLIKLAEEQTRTQTEERPVIKFLAAIDQLLASGHKYVDPIKGPANAFRNPSDLLGFSDSSTFYLFPDVTMNVLNQFYSSNDSGFPVSKNRLLDDLAKSNLIITQGGRNTITKRVGDKCMKLIALKKSAFSLVNGQKNEEEII